MDIFGYEFVRNAYIAGILIAGICGLLGIFLVQKKLSIIGDALSHTTFSAYAIAMILHVNPLIIAIPFTLFLAILIGYFSNKNQNFNDSNISIVSTFGLSIGIILVSVYGGSNIDISSFLFGNILSVNIMEIFILLVFLILTYLLFYIFYWKVFMTIFDSEFAKSNGIKVNVLDGFILILISLIISISMKFVGALLISSLLIVPAVISSHISKSFKYNVLISISIAELIFIFGITASILLNIPTGPTISVIGFSLLALIKILKI